MATPSNILDWKIPWTEEFGGLESMGSQRESDTTEQLNNNKYAKKRREEGRMEGKKDRRKTHKVGISSVSREKL